MMFTVAFWLLYAAILMYYFYFDPLKTKVIRLEQDFRVFASTAVTKFEHIEEDFDRLHHDINEIKKGIKALA